MGFAIAPTEFPSFSSCVPRHNCKNFINHERIHIPWFVHSRVGVIHKGAFASALKEQSAPKPKWESHVVNTLCEENLEQPCIPVNPDDTYACLLQACAEVKQVKQVHARMLRCCLDQNTFLANRLLSTYAMCGSMENAGLIFDKIFNRHVFVWNVMIRGYATNGPYEEALTVYSKMQWAGLPAGELTFRFVLKACAGLPALQEGKVVHGYVIKSGFESHILVDTALVDMYAKCGNIEAACQVFDKMSRRDVVSWGAMIAGYAQNGNADEALTLFHEMQLANMKPNPVTVVSVLQACAHLGDLHRGKSVHGYIIRSGFDSVIVGNCLVTMYANCGNVKFACQLFDKMSERRVDTWNAMIAGYAQNGHANEALALFQQMQLADVTPSAVTMASVLQACTHLGDLERGKGIHDYITRSGFESNVLVGNSLVTMYAKCGKLEIARHLFKEMPKRDLVSWNALIGGYAQNGHANEALRLFNQMQLVDMKPNSLTLLSVLPACACLAALQQDCTEIV